MPEVDIGVPFAKKSRLGFRTDYATGAGRLQWGEGESNKGNPNNSALINFIKRAMRNVHSKRKTKC